MSDMRDTLILPCRHLCLCNTCADSLRYQANNCPICRAPFRALLQIRALARCGQSATHPALAAEAHTEGVPPGYELVGLVEALNGPLAPQHPGPTVTLTSESHSMEQETKKSKKSRRRGSREQREKDRAEARRISAVVPQPPPVEQVETTGMGRKESITIDTEAGKRSDLVEEELRRESAEPEATSEDELLKDCKEEAAAMSLKENCQFYAGFGDVVARMHPPSHDIVAYRPAKARTNDEDEAYTGELRNVETFLAWAQEKCNPLVREITFENAEELTEEGLPFLILFHHPDDTL